MSLAPGPRRGAATRPFPHETLGAFHSLITPLPVSMQMKGSCTPDPPSWTYMPDFFLNNPPFSLSRALSGGYFGPGLSGSEKQKTENRKQRNRYSSHAYNPIYLVRR